MIFLVFIKTVQSILVGVHPWFLMIVPNRCFAYLWFHHIQWSFKSCSKHPNLSIPFNEQTKLNNSRLDETFLGSQNNANNLLKKILLKKWATGKWRSNWPKLTSLPQTEKLNLSRPYSRWELTQISLCWEEVEWYNKGYAPSLC